MGNFSRTVNRAFHAVIAICLSCMSVFVFMNVIMRYFFNSGLTWADEASRYLFIWLIFLGAIVAYQENAHLGVDTLVRQLSVTNRRRVFIFNHLLLAVVMGLCAHGTWELTLLTIDQVSASLRIPLACVYVSGFVCSASMTLISLTNLYRLIFKDVKENELIMTMDSEDQLFIDETLGEDAAEEGTEGAKKS